MKVTLEELRHVPGVRIPSFGLDRWRKCKWDLPYVFGFGDLPDGTQGPSTFVFPVSRGGLTFHLDVHGHLYILGPQLIGFGSGKELQLAHRVINDTAGSNRVEILSPLAATGIRRAVSDAIRPR